jgi:hypothetical protein
MVVELKVAPSPVPLCAICVKCTTAGGNAESAVLTWRSQKSVGVCVCPKGSGNTSMSEDGMSAGSGWHSESRPGMESSMPMTIEVMSGEPFLHTGWPMRHSGGGLWSTGAFIVAIIHRAATPYMYMTALRHRTNSIPLKPGRPCFLESTGVIRRVVNALVYPSLLTMPSETFGVGMRLVGLVNGNWPMSMGFTRPKSVTWSTGEPGGTWSEQMKVT